MIKLKQLISEQIQLFENTSSMNLELCIIVNFPWSKNRTFGGDSICIPNTLSRPKIYTNEKSARKVVRRYQNSIERILQLSESATYEELREAISPNGGYLSLDYMAKNDRDIIPNGLLPDVKEFLKKSNFEIYKLGPIKKI